MWSISERLVGRIGQQGTEMEARKEVEVSRWLNEVGIRAVRVIESIAQPSVVDGYPVTWWEQLSEHRPANPAELGAVLRRLHSMPPPTSFQLPEFVPLADVRHRVVDAQDLGDNDREWLLERTDILQSQYEEETVDKAPWGILHGDAWQGNLVVDRSGPVLLDFEAFCVGPQLWDLIPIAADYADFKRITDSQYAEFVEAYGLDVTAVRSFRNLADIQEVRWVTYLLGKRGDAEAKEAAHRISCLKGQIPRPWSWNAF
jgi:aminoglycoside phosphotransferase (APT) family kinase protein